MTPNFLGSSNPLPSNSLAALGNNWQQGYNCSLATLGALAAIGPANAALQSAVMNWVTPSRYRGSRHAIPPPTRPAGKQFGRLNSGPLSV